MNYGNIMSSMKFYRMLGDVDSAPANGVEHVETSNGFVLRCKLGLDTPDIMPSVPATKSVVSYGHPDQTYGRRNEKGEVE